MNHLATCILTAENMHTEDDCSMHDHETPTLYIEVTLPDGSVARWARVTEVDGEATIDDEALDDFLSSVESYFGPPDTVRA